MLCFVKNKFMREIRLIFIWVYFVPINLRLWVFLFHLLVLEERFRCKDCGATYKYLPGLCRHKKHYCGQLPRFPCHICPYQARQKVHLQTHMANKHYQPLLWYTSTITFSVIKWASTQQSGSVKFEYGKVFCRVISRYTVLVYQIKISSSSWDANGISVFFFSRY